MDDRLLANRAIGGDLDNFGQLYDRYFVRVYDLAWRTLRDDDAAAQVTQAVFLEAMRRLPEGGKAPSFAAWIFGIAHRLLTDRAGAVTPETAGHDEAFGSLSTSDPSQLDVADATDSDGDLAALIWESASALGPRDYALLDLHVRQGLDAEELAPILGMHKNNASTLLKRMRSAADDVMRDYVLARQHAGDCANLQAALTTANFPPYSDAVREAVSAHARECDVCREHIVRIPEPLPIFASLAPVDAPMPLKGDVWRTVASAWPYRTREVGGGVGTLVAAGAGAAALTSMSSGFGGGAGTLPPVPGTAGDGEALRNRIIMFGTAAVVLLIIAFAAAAIISGVGGGDGSGAGASGSDDDTPGASRTAGVPGVSVDTPTPEPTDTPRGSVTPTPSPSVTPTPTAGLPSPVPPQNTPPPPPPPTATRPPVVNTPVPTPTRFSFD